MKLVKNTDIEVKFQVSALIDVVFLLLIYFMVTAAVIKTERELAFKLPNPDGVPASLPVEVLVEIGADGAVEMDGIRFARGDSDLKALVARLSSLKKLASSQQAEFYVSILPHHDALHYRVIDVMDACADAGVKKLGFSKAL